jgi:hypothetical protein
MAFPSGYQTPTSNVDAGTGNPASARVDIYNAFLALNDIIASENQPNGVVTLNGAGLISSSMMPSSLTSGSLTLAPDDQFVKVEDYLRLQIIPKATVLAKADVVIGDMCLAADDLTGANPKLAFFDGTDWRYLDITTLTVLS